MKYPQWKFVSISFYHLWVTISLVNFIIMVFNFEMRIFSDFISQKINLQIPKVLLSSTKQQQTQKKNDKMEDHQGSLFHYTDVIILTGTES